MSTINGIIGTTPVPQTTPSIYTNSTNPTKTKSSTGSTATATPAGTVDKDMFLQLLVAQLRYQDPSKPVDSSQFMAQTAQFSMVEQLTNVVSSQTDMLSAQRMATATAMVGKTISYLDADDLPVTGVVSSVSFSGSIPTLKVGNTDVPLSSVKEVKTTA